MGFVGVMILECGLLIDKMMVEMDKKALTGFLIAWLGPIDVWGLHSKLYTVDEYSNCFMCAESGNVTVRDLLVALIQVGKVNADFVVHVRTI